MLVIAAFGVLVWYLATLIWNVVASIGLAIVVAVILAPFVLKLRDSIVPSWLDRAAQWSWRAIGNDEPEDEE